MSDKHMTQQYIVYQDLNEPTTILVARADEIVAGTFKPIAGPLDSREAAEKAAYKAKLEGVDK